MYCSRTRGSLIFGASSFGGSGLGRSGSDLVFEVSVCVMARHQACEGSTRVLKVIWFCRVLNAAAVGLQSARLGGLLVQQVWRNGPMGVGVIGHRFRIFGYGRVGTTTGLV